MIADVFIKRPVTAMVISIVILLVGAISIINLPVSQYPDITPPTVQVEANYTGADAQTVEETVATPTEIQINGTPGMAYMSSNSTNNGMMSATVTFDIGTDIDIAALDVQNRVSVAEPTLPEAVRRLGITVRKRNPTILMGIALYSPNGTYDRKFLSNYASIYLRDALLRVKGVGDVRNVGQDFSMRIWLNPHKMSQLNITSNEVTAALQDQNMQVAGGQVGVSPQDEAQAFEYSILLNGRISEEEEFEKVIIRTNPDGSIVYLKDIARVELGQFNYSAAATTNGKPSTMLLVNQIPGGNALETAEGITETLEQLKTSFPKDLDYTVGFESITVVKVSINEVIHTLVEALVLVTLVVFFFLQSWRATLIPILAIPVSIVGTFIFFIPLDFTINTLTLFGFVLSIGIVVDDAIVVVEAVQHYIDNEGLSAKEATRAAMKDISAPVIAIALILAAVFIPVGFIPGMVGRLYQQFAITIAISVLLSAFVALSLTPALCSIMLKPMKLDENSRGLNKFFYKFNRWFAKTTENYGKGVQYAIKKTPLALVMLVCIYLGTGLLFKAKPTGFIPQEDEGRLFISITLPEGASTSRTAEVIDSVASIIQNKFPQFRTYTGIAGLNALNFSFKSNSATFFTQLKPWDERKAPEDKIDAIVANLRKEVSGIKGANIVVVTPPAIPGMGNTGGFSFMLEQRQAGSVQSFEENVNKFIMAANQRPEIAMAYTFFNAQTPSYQVNIDREKAKRMGIPLNAIYSTISNFMGSAYINDFTRFGRNFRVVTQAESQYRSDVVDLNGYYVTNNEGVQVPISAIASWDRVKNAALISHYNLFRSAEINGDAAPGYSSGQAMQALEEVASEVLPTGYGYDFSGLSLEEASAGNTTTIIFMLSIIFVFLLLAALYESWSVPFSIILSVPLGAFGAIVTLMFIPKLTNNIYAQIGLITLIGLSAKNAILIVEYAKERLDWGMGLLPATIEAVKLRLRPIIMTSVAFILGVFPLALSSGAGAVSRQTIGWTVVGGMFAATLLALFIVPVLFVIISRIAYGKKKLQELEANYNPDEHSHKSH
ncbi:multidrug efflux RND transporter permease subunit [Olivibacter sp. SDN3]|uniref:efflux RND transporter permease subunit n=1 Tax=Olivibacter sp. SDN3 TaxID=2764720 RepID=UPI001651631D|nr:multidrug efflux RND transporter permease subunit [Olivibacter sp. SDN3]QNL48869.1 multidrug efflux RND transporter permease subunit [Olivibacter sp. SDN3]